MKARMPLPENSLDRSRRLKSLLVTKSKLIGRQYELDSILEETLKEINANKINLNMVEKQITDLTPEKGTTITEHALLRYCERYRGIDLEEVHKEIMDLPQEDKIMASNTIITVFPTIDDHFNLAENESRV